MATLSCTGHLKLFQYCRAATITRIAQISAQSQLIQVPGRRTLLILFLLPRYYHCTRAYEPIFRTYTVPNMTALKHFFQAILRHKRTPVVRRSAKYGPVSQRGSSSGRSSFYLRYIVARLVGVLAIHYAVEHAHPGTFIPALVEAGQRNIVGKAEERLEYFQKSTPAFVDAGRRSIEDNAEKRLANFDKLCRTLHIPRYRSGSS